MCKNEDGKTPIKETRKKTRIFHFRLAKWLKVHESLKPSGQEAPRNRTRASTKDRKKEGLEVAIRNKIEMEVTQKASSSLHKPLSVVKGAEGKGNPGAARPGTSSK
ncbi:hypothetical protein F2P81_010588 [Scophthalmus maximus]|uniref:Uncharacterized protein n=1 Tax=Scophthalmus maximus TaxID=52904 RepID=A0A6A4T3A4_SCOMX|nr:hypothetical protein F2P81_010588 [Scophthalmus maximus]